ncbi:bifunctional phosphoserine phosphatase/homoserine phosphotransferase ThrH [Agrobacterium vitis]|uniref:Bifunctional phosphoserine phosphatase/homoserine phosphotransferase ThrH n=2 Tax=Agrobacterium vitis TaxID=373 RepID=A0A7K1RNH2_AGRVI|nr:bifunctional phosphoserine phosphatase/homoserine phosphotransferase ThrH [Agrobacterium vitis]
MSPFINAPGAEKMIKICLDVEGVLLPEVWLAIAVSAGIDELKITTRDEPDYNALMRRRIAILREYKIDFDDIRVVLRTLSPLDGALEFLHQLRRDYQVALVSDSYSEFLGEFSELLNWPEIYCHSLAVSANQSVLGWRPRLLDQKPKCVKAFQALGFRVFAAGDSFNDIGMLEAADGASFIHAPSSIKSMFPHIDSCSDYSQLRQMIDWFAVGESKQP